MLTISVLKHPGRAAAGEQLIPAEKGAEQNVQADLVVRYSCDHSFAGFRPLRNKNLYYTIGRRNAD